ncbi:chorismate mutase [Brevibacterium antiquum]|uniref:Chorismate mutase n=2 Tax=Brevibacterium antiquum TaxID=234835 RepID=A0A2H1HUJ9_9MICO|nr:chorismate mutase [Brevibacterium antiquum CNRZ 918]SMX90982.1 chorismate mutase [Brevibacterium antiquum]
MHGAGSVSAWRLRSGLRLVRLVHVDQINDKTRAQERLLELRGSIDNIDAALIHLLAERFKLTETVGELKADHGLPPADPAREGRQVAHLRRLAEDAHLDPEFAEKFLTFIVAEVIRHHERIAETREA